METHSLEAVCVNLPMAAGAKAWGDTGSTSCTCSANTCHPNLQLISAVLQHEYQQDSLAGDPMAG